MTAFNRTDIPASVDTLEKLVVWANSLFNYLNPTITAIEGIDSTDAVTIRVAQFSPYFMSAVNTDQHWRVISRQSIRLEPSWQLGSTKIWTSAIELSSTAIPTEFKS